MKYNVKAFNQESVFYPYEHLAEVVRWAQYKGRKQGEEVNPVVLEITEVDDEKQESRRKVIELAIALRDYLSPTAPWQLVDAFDAALVDLDVLEIRNSS